MRRSLGTRLGLLLIFSVNTRSVSEMRRESLIVLVLLLLGACQPHLTYEKLEEAAQTDPKMAKRLEKFEADVEKADQFIFLADYCNRESQCRMFCVYNGVAPSHERSPNHPNRTVFANLDEKVRWYRTVRMSCGFNRRGM